MNFDQNFTELSFLFNNIPAVVEIMAWHRPGDKPLYEPMMVSLLMRSVHYDDVTMGAIASQITSLTIAFSTVYLDTDQRKHQSSASLAFVRGIHRRPVNSPHKWPVPRKMFPFDDVIMYVLVISRDASGYMCNPPVPVKYIVTWKIHIGDIEHWWWS